MHGGRGGGGNWMKIMGIGDEKKKKDKKKKGGGADDKG